MATKQTPKHDFAPSWLKLDQEQSRKARASGHDKGNSRNSQREDYFNNYNRYPHPNPDFPFHPLQRQRSFDYFDERRFSQEKFRHHSVDDDYYMSPPPYSRGYPGYYNGYPGGDSHYRSQPTLMRDGKYQHPNANARPNQPPPPQMMNGMFPPYFEPYYEYYAEPYYGGPPARGGKRGKHDGRHSRGEGRERKSLDGSDGNSKKGSLDDDFPSLNGDAEPPEKTKSRGAWEDQNGEEKDKEKPHEYKFKASLGSKASMSPKLLGLDGLQHTAQVVATGKDINSNGPVKLLQSPSSKQDEHAITKPATPAIAIASPSPDISGQNGHHDDTLSNGMDALSVTPEACVLSSSLEAEQRLLFEMGWKEDAEDYEITEEDRKQFQSLSQQKANPLRESQKKNGLTRTQLPVPWSPMHATMCTVSALDFNEDLSSSDSDSDIE